MSDPQGRLLAVVVMGRPINQAVWRMSIATLRVHVLDETNWEMLIAISSRFGFEKASVNNDNFSKT
jgi:hypothetical protein